MKAKNIFIFIAVMALFSSCKDKNNNKGMMQVLNVPVVEVTTKNMNTFQSFPTNIEGKINNAVRAKISGYIREVYVDEGQFVQKGQAMFRLETDVQSQDANAAKSAIGAAEANISAAQATVNAAQVEVDKLVPLVAKNIISQVQLETAQANLLRAKGQLEQAKATHKQTQAAYSAIATNIGFGVVKSPVSGVVGTINFREGSLVGPSDPMPITMVSETSEVYAYFSMNEAEYLDFLEESPGKTLKEKLDNIPDVELTLANGKTYPKKGKIKTVTGQIDPATGSIQFRATFDNAEHLLSNGNSGFINIPKHYENVLVVPENATYERQGITYVYKLKQDTAYNTPIDVEARMNNTVIVNSGLQKGDIVIVQGLGKLRHLMAVESYKVDMDSLIQSVKPIM